MKLHVSPTTFLAHVCAITIVLIFGVAIGLAAPCLPRIEGFLRPIIKATLADGSITRDDQKACFALDVHKLHAAEPLIYQFSVEVRQNEHWLASIDVNAHIMYPSGDDRLVGFARER